MNTPKTNELYIKMLNFMVSEFYLKKILALALTSYLTLGEILNF